MDDELDAPDLADDSELDDDQGPALDTMRSDEAATVALIAALLPRRRLLALADAVRRDLHTVQGPVSADTLAGLASWHRLVTALTDALRASTPQTATAAAQSIVRAEQMAATLSGGTAQLEPAVVHADTLVRLHRALETIPDRAGQLISDGTDPGEAIDTGLDWAGHQAGTLVRTGQNRAWRDGLWNGWAAVGGGGWIWRVVGDERTCGSCWAMEGSWHPVSEQLYGHVRCRCTMERDTGDGQQAAVDNQDAAFDALPDDTQYALLGPGRYAAWQAGRVTVDNAPGTGVAEVVTSPTWGRQVATRPLADVVGADNVAAWVARGLATRTG